MLAGQDNFGSSILMHPAFLPHGQAPGAIPITFCQRGQLGGHPRGFDAVARAFAETSGFHRQGGTSPAAA